MSEVGPEPGSITVEPFRFRTGDVPLVELPKPRARGLTLISILALVLSPFPIPTFGVGIALGVFLIVACIVLTRRGYRARAPLAAGVVAVVVGAASAGACGWFVLRTVEVTGGEEVRQDRVEDRFERAFEDSERAPNNAKESVRDAGVAPDAQSPATREEPR
ncbi:MAG: hypothetical protein Q8O67_12325 [Deltaproteobacteria bacterium]|nr:hypothetical protein [Deltaproteobacteria bacterium]